MNTYTITKNDLNDKNEYIGKTDLSDYDGHIESDANLGYVRIISVCASGHIWMSAGTGIKAGAGIEAGTCIKAGAGIEAGDDIKAGGGIKAGAGPRSFRLAAREIPRRRYY